MKPILFTTLGILTCLGLSAQIEGPAVGSSFLNNPIAGYNQSWVNSDRVGASDNSYASFNNLADIPNSHTDYLIASDFKFMLTDGIVIKGIKVEIECSDPNSRTSDYSVRIIKMGAMGTQEKALGTPYPAADGSIIYGGPTDLWGETWIHKEIDDYSFGVAIAAQRNASGSTTAGQIDNVTITVYYNMVTLPVTLTSFTATKQSKTVALNWNAATEINMDHYEVERSSNGINFYSLSSIPCSNLSVATNYSYSDASPLSGVSYYRLKMDGIINGDRKYSPIVSVHFDKHATISLSPCPWTKGSDLLINNPGREVLRIQFYNAEGQMISNVITSSENVPTETLSNKSGKLYYNVFNSKSQLLGTGTFIIQ